MVFPGARDVRCSHEEAVRSRQVRIGQFVKQACTIRPDIQNFASPPSCRTHDDCNDCLHD